ncbi:MAG: PilZ domain-containing protein [Fimbriimonadales bacterium]
MLAPGSTLLIVRNPEEPSTTVSGKVAVTSPLRVEGLCSGPNAPFAEGDRVALLYTGSEKSSQAWAVVVHTQGFGDRWSAEFRPDEWVELDRRRTTRYAVNLSADGTAVLEPSRSPELHSDELAIENLSETGCFATTEMNLSRGDLISVSIVDPVTGERHRVLGIVARVVEPNGFGIEFFDYSGDARGWLGTHLANIRDNAERGAA